MSSSSSYLCNGCGVKHIADDFSAKQLKLKGKRKCKDCLEKHQGAVYYLKPTATKGVGMFAAHNVNEINAQIVCEEEFLFEPCNEKEKTALQCKFNLAAQIRKNPHFYFKLNYNPAFLELLNQGTEEAKTSLAQAQSNGVKMKDGMYVFLTLSKVNHSCDPNCFFLVEHVEDTKTPTEDENVIDLTKTTHSASLAAKKEKKKKTVVVLRTLRPIARDEELTVSYLGLGAVQPVGKRGEETMRQWKFKCECARCTNPEHPIEKLLRATRDETKDEKETIAKEFEAIDRMVDILSNSQTMNVIKKANILQFFQMVFKQFKITQLADTHWKIIQLKSVLFKVFESYVQKHQELLSFLEEIKEVQRTFTEAMKQVAPNMHHVKMLHNQAETIQKSASK
jgi:hypothetical protein